MLPNQDAHPGCSSSNHKRRRTDDSLDTSSLGPPTKISKTGSAPLPHRRDDSEETLEVHEIQAASELERALTETLKARNAIALCSLRVVTRVCIKVLSWIVHESTFGRPVLIVVDDNPSVMQQFRAVLQRDMSAVNIRTVTREDDLAVATDMGVVLASAEDFLQFISRSSLSQTKFPTVIVFDHALLEHGTGSSVMVSKIMIDHSSCSVLSTRPRILVLIPTLRRDIPSDSNIHHLRTVLNATVIGLTDTEENVSVQKLSNSSRPMELVITYRRQDNFQETLLCKKLQDLDPENVHLGRYFRNAMLALGELGPCAADLVWRETFGSSAQSEEIPSTADMEDQSPLMEARNLVKHWPFKLPNLDKTSRNMNVSHKFIRLVQVLESYRSHEESFRGIVFVQRRITAQLLVALLHSLIPRLQFLRPVALVNHRLSSDYVLMEDIYRQFASGRYNLLVATKSYEDTTLPQASAVILFDVFESQVSLACTRRFVGNGGHFIHMVEDENNFHRHALARTSFDAVMHRWADAIQHDSSWPVPPRPLRESYDAYISDSEDDQDSDLVQDPVTGHHLHKHQASATLYRYASRLANLSGDHPFFTYTSSENAGLKEWRCTIKLAGTHIDNFSGPSCPSRYLARRETSYAACRQLQHLEELDSSIFSRRNNTNERFIPGDEDEVQIDTGHERPHVPLSTDFWTNSMTRPPFPDVLYPRILSTADPGSGLDERAPMCILTRAPLPEFSQFRLFHLREPVEIRVNRSAPVKLDLTRLEQAHRFTVKFCRIIMNKPFESPSWQSMGYLFLPMKRNWRPPPEMDQRSSHLVLADGVDWNMVSRVSENWAAPVDPVHLERELEDAVIQDRAVEFTHRCEVTRIRNDISPLTEVDDKPKGYSMLKYAAFAADERFAQGGKTLLEQCHSRRKTFEGLKDPNQPILEVKRMPGATNCLNPRIPPNKEVPEKVVQLLIPEYSRKLTVPASTLRMGYLLPSITRKIDELLLVKQLNAKLLDHCVKDDLLAIATSSPLAGNNYDYERLELLGDAFLKYLSSTYVYTQNPHGSEGDMHTARQKYISNQQLCNIASRLGLPGYIQLKPFSIKSWMPPGMTVVEPQKKELPAVNASEPSNITFPQQTSVSSKPNDDSLIDSNQGKGSKNRKKRVKKNAYFSPIANKTVADVVEAIIGAAYISGGRESALKAAKSLRIPFTEVEEWSDFDRRECTPQMGINRFLDTSAVAVIEDTTGHTFRKRHLLALALTHSTFNTAEMKIHQRLEFIGDAVLDFLVVRYLYEKNEHASPGDLSVLKSMMVSNSTLAAVCVWSGLHRFIHATQQLGQTIQNYEKALLAQQAAVLAGTHDRTMIQYWKDLEAPKTLSDVVESIIGAALISDGFSQVGVDGIFNTLLLPFYEKYVPLQISKKPSCAPHNKGS